MMNESRINAMLRAHMRSQRCAWDCLSYSKVKVKIFLYIVCKWFVIVMDMNIKPKIFFRLELGPDPMTSKHTFVLNSIPRGNCTKRLNLKCIKTLPILYGLWNCVTYNKIRYLLHDHVVGSESFSSTRCSKEEDENHVKTSTVRKTTWNYHLYLTKILQVNELKLNSPDFEAAHSKIQITK